MADKLKVVRSVQALRAHIRDWRRQGLLSALVPTMGALHAGHISLVEQGLRTADRVVVTIFVNPQQFAPNEDLDAYPRSEKADIEKLRKAGAHLVFVPEPIEIYPEGFCTTVSLAGPAKAGLEDAFRPHFFDGVTTVVAKLFTVCNCDYAMFGEKDFQQLKVVTTMARDLGMPMSVRGVETVREEDGLAMSSRNAYLNEQERAIAPKLHETLQQLAASVRDGENIEASCEAASAQLAEAGFRPDYVAARAADTLLPIEEYGRSEIRLLAAAWLGKTRLIDNISV